MAASTTSCIRWVGRDVGGHVVAIERKQKGISDKEAGKERLDLMTGESLLLSPPPLCYAQAIKEQG